jgi:hypothetical protein
MTKADELSRRPDHKRGVEDDNQGIVLLPPERIGEVAGAAIRTKGDVLLDTIWGRTDFDESVIRNKEGPKFEEADGLLFRRKLVVIPRDDAIRFESHHDNQVSGHPGQYRTLKLITRNYWWPNVMKDTAKYVTE